MSRAYHWEEKNFELCHPDEGEARNHPVTLFLLVLLWGKKLNVSIRNMALFCGVWGGSKLVLLSGICTHDFGLGLAYKWWKDAIISWEIVAVGGTVEGGLLTVFLRTEFEMWVMERARLLGHGLRPQLSQEKGWTSSTNLDQVGPLCWWRKKESLVKSFVPPVFFFAVHPLQGGGSWVSKVIPAAGCQLPTHCPSSPWPRIVGLLPSLHHLWLFDKVLQGIHSAWPTVKHLSNLCW